MRAAESDFTRLASLLQLREHGEAYRAMDEHVYDKVRHFLRRRHKVSSHGTHQFPEERVYGSLGVCRLQGEMGARL